MARTTLDDWLADGLQVLRAGGESALTIDRLCADLGRTKGAFYHHFADISAYVDALLDAWEGRNTTAAIEAADAETNPSARRRALDVAVGGLDARLDLAVRAWGLRDARAAAFVSRVDARRIAYLADIYPQDMPKARRVRLARLEYAAFVGAQQLFPDLSVPAAREMNRMLHLALAGLFPAPTPAALRKRKRSTIT